MSRVRWTGGRGSRVVEAMTASFLFLSVTLLILSLVRPFEIKWVRGTYSSSYARMGWATRHFVFQIGGIRYGLGDVYLSHDDGPMVNPFPTNVSEIRRAEPARSFVWMPQLGGRYQVDFTLPLWPLVVIAGVVWWVLRRARRAQERIEAQGLCPNCHYDLRATPGRCPECGMVRASEI